MKENCFIFDYSDLYYNNEDPLYFLLRKNTYQTIREVFFMMSKKEQNLLYEIIIKERSKIDFSIKENIHIKSLDEFLDNTLELYLNLYKNTYNS